MQEMTSIERMTNALARQPVDHVPAAVSLWGATVERWTAEGHLKEDEDVIEHFGQDFRSGGWLNSVVDLDFEGASKVASEVSGLALEVDVSSEDNIEQAITETADKKWYHSIPFLNPKTVTEYRIINGTRNVVLKDGCNKYYDCEAFREKVTMPFRDLLHKDEVVYYEIVGYTETGQLIMPNHPTAKLEKALRKQLGDEVSYLYGCGQSPNLNGKKVFEQRIFVYRIASVNEDGVVNEYSWDQVKDRCLELNLEHVPEIPNGVFYDYGDNISSTFSPGKPGTWKGEGSYRWKASGVFFRRRGLAPAWLECRIP